MSSSAISLKGAQGNDALRNLINNAAFNEWNMGSTFELTTDDTTKMLVSTTDGWFIRYYTSNGTTSDNLKVEKQPHTVGQTSVEGNPLYYTRVKEGNITSGVSGEEIVTFSQRIPNVRAIQNETVALSFYAKGHTADQKVGVCFSQVFGVSGNTADEFGLGKTASNPVSVQGQEVGLTGDWRKYNLRFNIPSISGKEIGLAGENYTELNFVLQAGATTASNRSLLGAIDGKGATFDIANVQLERGVDFTAFENIQQNTAIKEMIGLHITGVASGQITEGATTLANAQSMTYLGLTAADFTAGARTVADGFFVNLNDISTDQNNILKFGRFFSRSRTAGQPIFIVSPSLTNTSTSNDFRDIQCFASNTEDERILKIVAHDNKNGTLTNLSGVNLMAFQMNLAAPGTFGGGNESNTDEEDNGGGSGRPCTPSGGIIPLGDIIGDGEDDVDADGCGGPCTATQGFDGGVDVADEFVITPCI